MTELKIDEAAGTFEISGLEAQAFREYLLAQGITCDPGPRPHAVKWTEAEDTFSQPETVCFKPVQHDRLHEIPKLYRSWRGGGQA
jgi:hypothetical protein